MDIFYHSKMMNYKNSSLKSIFDKKDILKNEELYSYRIFLSCIFHRAIALKRT
jgi:hypothetical protein